MGCAASSQGADAANQAAGRSPGPDGKGVDPQGYGKGQADNSTSIHIFADQEAGGAKGALLKKQVCCNRSCQHAPLCRHAWQEAAGSTVVGLACIAADVIHAHGMTAWTLPSALCAPTSDGNSWAHTCSSSSPASSSAVAAFT